nr:hypothetical protein [uncultured Lichenicoccus sp.]
MARRFSDQDLPLPTVRSTMESGDGVGVRCNRCDHLGMLELPARVTAGKGSNTLVHLPLRYQGCGSADVGIIVMAGRIYHRPAGVPGSS